MLCVRDPVDVGENVGVCVPVTVIVPEREGVLDGVELDDAVTVIVPEREVV